jgi:prepilin-type processing-associated H-X9-DG protein
MYCNRYDGTFPLAYADGLAAGGPVSYAWDFTTSKDWSTDPPKVRVEGGLLFQGLSVAEIYQCPSFSGESNWLADPYTGYNYNTSYIGHGTGEAVVAPARLDDVQQPSACALFGDGEYAAGANKFMRSPLPSPADIGFAGRTAGTQGYRHLGKTNVAFVDGHAESWAKCFDGGFGTEVAPGTGFLSQDNRAYDPQWQPRK